MKLSKLTRNKRSAANKQRTANGKYTSKLNKIKKLSRHLRSQPNDSRAYESLKRIKQEV